MRIAFICGSLEPGKDGVGDYTWRLAKSLHALGVQIAVIAANDSHIQTVIAEASDKAPQILRIPKIWTNSLRVKQIEAFLRIFNPDWVSLQYVIFSFHSKGLPVFFNNDLRGLLSGLKIHIMFHELWVGMDENAGLKHRLWGGVQKRMIGRLIGTLRPKQIDTNTDLYQAQLKSLGVDAGILPLFGNIPIVKKKQIQFLGNEIDLVLFGGIHHGAPVETFALEVANYSKKNNKRVTLHLLGRCGDEQKKWIYSWNAVGLQVKVWGAVSDARVSEILAASTAGVTTTPVSLVQKSGSVAAMQEHGLPVICVARDWVPRFVNQLSIPQNVLVYHKGNFDQLFRFFPIIPENNLEGVTKSMLLKLSN
ncbi:glycosyltransferase family 4 protein [Mucilaginibacter agri]|uniref:Glycosyltransferase subfamily 4-like N-terminal domain-containing protein n=1 Tax=Mucilaginibacter agri TaxID=2695265 RepID=A0A965ZDK3_9SPHI|nr:glycosyltransferase family 4 protein [Mucilaginibacter agri]NCD67816.1 hypothetical protein [Mucilaginibacter agri]